MLIRSLELKNFLSHRETTLYFDRGINMIVGHNGAGKTSILDAIKFAMFGKDRARLSNPVSHGSTACYVKLTFQVDEDTYEIMRSYGERQRDREATIARNGMEIANSQDAVTSTVERIIGMEQDVFEKSVFVAQGEIDDLVNEQPKKRKEFFSRMIGIEKLSNTAALLGEISRDVNSSISEAKGKLERLSVYRENLARSLHEKERLSDELGKAADSISDVVKEEKRLKDLLSNQKDAVADLHGKASLLASRRSEYSRIASEVAAIEGKLKKHETMMHENRRIEENPLYIYHGEIMEASGSISRLIDLSQMKKEIAEAEGTSKDLAGQVSELQKDHDMYASSMDESAMLSRTLKTLEPSNDRWKIASDRLALIMEEIKPVEARINNLGPEVEKIFGSLDIDASTVSNRIGEIEKHIDDIGKRINAKKSELGSLNERKRELSSRIDQLRGKNVCPLCGSELSPDHVIRLHADVHESVETTLGEIGKVAAEISNLSTEQDKLRNMLAQMRSRSISDYIQGTESLRSRKQAMIETKKELEKLEREHAQYAATRKRLDELEIIIDRARDKESRYALAATRLEAARQNLSKNSLSDVETEIGKHQQVISKIESLTGLSLDQKKLEESSSLYRRHTELAAIAKEYNQLSLSVEEKRKLSAGLEEEIRNLQKDVGKLDELVAEEKRLDAEFDKVRDRHAELTGLVGSRRESISRIEGEIEELKKNIIGLEATEKTVMAMKSSIETINKLRAAFGVDGIQKYLRQKASEFITNGTRQILSSFSLDFDDVIVNEDFDVSVQKSGLLELDALSGGERIALSIALRISISRFLDEEQRMNCFLMDEPTTYLDEERRANLRNILHYALGESEHLPQLILITHHAELISAGDAVFEVSKESGISRVSS